MYFEFPFARVPELEGKSNQKGHWNIHINNVDRNVLYTSTFMVRLTTGSRYYDTEVIAI